jgi:hypothetical protein
MYYRIEATRFFESAANNEEFKSPKTIGLYPIFLQMVMKFILKNFIYSISLRAS